MNKKSCLFYKLSFFCSMIILLTSCASMKGNKCKVPGEEYREPAYKYHYSGQSNRFSLVKHVHNKYYQVKKCNNYPNLLFSTTHNRMFVKTHTPLYSPNPYYTKRTEGFRVYSQGNLCDEEPKITFHRNGVHKHDFLKTFYIDNTAITTNTIKALVDIIRRECNVIPERIRISGTKTKKSKPPAMVGVYFVPYEREVIYGGTVYAKGLSRPELFDDNPEERKRYMDAHFKEQAYRLQMEEQAYRLKRQQRDDLVNSVFAVTAGLLQGLSYELSDEGFCAILSSNLFKSGSSISQSEFRKCHNYLNDLLDEVRAEKPMLYAISNILGMMRTDVSDTLPVAKTRLGTAVNRGVSGCFEAMFMEHNNMRIGQKVDEDILKQACNFGFVIDGATGFIAGPKN